MLFLESVKFVKKVRATEKVLISGMDFRRKRKTKPDEKPALR